MRAVLVVFAALVLMSCGTQSLSPSTRMKQDASDGIVILSITRTMPVGTFSVLYRQIDGTSTGRIQHGTPFAMTLIPILPKNDFADANAKGELFVVKLPPGHYEFYNWEVVSSYVPWRGSHPFSIPFTVEPGKAVYAGNFDFKKTSSFGLSVTGVDVSYRDEAARDMARFAEKYSTLASVPLASTIAPGADVNKLGSDEQTPIGETPIVPAP